jgi:hypothetical protein
MERISTEAVDIYGQSSSGGSEEFGLFLDAKRSGSSSGNTGAVSTGYRAPSPLMVPSSAGVPKITATSAADNPFIGPKEHAHGQNGIAADDVPG